MSCTKVERKKWKGQAIKTEINDLASQPWTKMHDSHTIVSASA